MKRIVDRDSLTRVDIICPHFSGRWTEDGLCHIVTDYNQNRESGQGGADPTCTASDQLDFVEIGASHELAKARRESRLHDTQPDLVWSDGTVRNGSEEVSRRAELSRCAYVSMYCVERRMTR